LSRSGSSCLIPKVGSSKTNQVTTTAYSNYLSFPLHFERGRFMKSVVDEF
jgi:hypothetical protein